MRPQELTHTGNSMVATSTTSSSFVFCCGAGAAAELEAAAHVVGCLCRRWGTGGATSLQQLVSAARFPLAHVALAALEAGQSLHSLSTLQPRPVVLTLPKGVRLQGDRRCMDELTRVGTLAVGREGLRPRPVAERSARHSEGQRERLP